MDWNRDQQFRAAGGRCRRRRLGQRPRSAQARPRRSGEVDRALLTMKSLAKIRIIRPAAKETIPFRAFPFFTGARGLYQYYSARIWRIRPRASVFCPETAILPEQPKDKKNTRKTGPRPLISIQAETGQGRCDPFVPIGVAHQARVKAGNSRGLFSDPKRRNFPLYRHEPPIHHGDHVADVVDQALALRLLADPDFTREMASRRSNALSDAI